MGSTTTGAAVEVLQPRIAEAAVAGEAAVAAAIGPTVEVAGSVAGRAAERPADSGLHCLSG